MDFEIRLCKCHGLPMRRNGSIRWRCSVKCVIRDRERNKSPRRKKQNRENFRRYMQTHIMTEIGGVRHYIPVPSDQKQELQKRLFEFRSQQMTDYRKEAESGWID